MFQLPPASAQRLADSIRKELRAQGVICRLIIRAPASMWDLVDGKVKSGREVLELTTVPGDNALFSLARCIVTKRRKQGRKLGRRECAFVVHVAREAQREGLWWCTENPQKVVFHCAPVIRRVSTIFPSVLIERLLQRLDACVGLGPGVHGAQPF